MSVCRYCQTAEIVWAVTGTGRSMPVDAQPAAEGNVRLLDRAGVLHAEVLGPLERQIADESNEQLHWPHHATCPAVKAKGGKP